ncbi:hypothetical protein BCU84_09890 [Shewanella sp. 10N.286.51.B7]|uniref:hypothetical protein n=1 Tax=Shewanella sp. 10N.286.51.B7 TaxID=1880836 RepID=UPI000C860C7F|nr:hypothetical protein [Shewanella sp. 10N.286.51.B7]PMG77748.1 hypothetical protein BCU84_09890 [Shewanella sp. 10N.286.51.B7]
MLIEQLVDLLDKTPWQLDNPTWVKQRKKDWAELSKTLRDMGSFLPKDVRYYKSYYLTGELPEIKDQLKDLPEHANCTILLLLHPLQTEENITELYFTFCQLRKDAKNQQQTAYLDDRYDDKNFFFHWILAEQNVYFKGNSQGVVHGLEEVYCRLLYGTTEQQWQEFTRGHKGAFGAFCSANIKLLLNPDAYVSYHYQYLVDFSFYMAPQLDYTFGRTPIDNNQFLQLIQYYELLDPFKGIDEERYKRAWKLVNLTREKLNTTELPEPLQQMWDFAQTPEGKEATYSSFPKKYPILTVLTE